MGPSNKGYIEDASFSHQIGSDIEPSTGFLVTHCKAVVRRYVRLRYFWKYFWNDWNGSHLYGTVYISLCGVQTGFCSKFCFRQVIAFTCLPSHSSVRIKAKTQSLISVGCGWFAVCYWRAWWSACSKECGMLQSWIGPVVSRGWYEHV